MIKEKLKYHLDRYYDSLLEYKHVSSRINNVFNEDLKKYSSEKSLLHISSLLIIRDWSGKSVSNGGTYCFPTDSMIYTNKENYCLFINKVLSEQFCLMYVQSYESFERFLKNIIYELALNDDEIKNSIISQLKQNQSFSRENIKGDKLLFELIIKNLSGKKYKKDKIEFDEKSIFYILSKTRNHIVHDNCRINKSILFCSKEKEYLFKELFLFEELDSKNIKIVLNSKTFQTLIDFMSNYAFQIIKNTCIKYDLDWRFYKNMNQI